MFKRELRLGDTVDDYCVRCKLILDHGIVAIVDGEVKKVRCLTCSFEHAYKESKGARPKKSAVKSLFDQVAAGISGHAISPEPSAKKAKKPRGSKK